MMEFTKEQLKNEEWRDIVIMQDGKVYDFTNLYQVSNIGRVRSLNYRRWGVMKVLKPHDNGGYLDVMLCKNGEHKRFLIHRLVSTMFIPNDDPVHKTQVNHINENRQDNRVENLEWVTPKENVNHGTRNERASKKMTNGKNSKKVICIETGEVFESINEIQRRLGLAQNSICRCCNGTQGTCGKLHWKFYSDYLIEQLMVN